MKNTPMALVLICVCALLGGAWLAGSAQMRVNAGATWADAPPASGVHITTGDDRDLGGSTIIMNSNGEHWWVGLYTIGGASIGLLIGLGMLVSGGADEG